MTDPGDEAWLRRRYPNREPLPPGRLLGPRDPHPTCVTAEGVECRRLYRWYSRCYARNGERITLEDALDNLCWWIEAEEDARVERERARITVTLGAEVNVAEVAKRIQEAMQRERIRPARSAEPREPFEPVKPSPLWRAWLARVWPWWG